MPSSTCHGLDQCRYWYSHDDRCDRVTDSHSAMCVEHADHDYGQWWTQHETDQCCNECCKGEIDHE